MSKKLIRVFVVGNDREPTEESVKDFLKSQMADHLGGMIVNAEVEFIRAENYLESFRSVMTDELAFATVYTRWPKGGCHPLWVMNT